PAESWRSWHAEIMPDSGIPAAALSTAARAGFLTLSPLFLPTRLHEDPKLERLNPRARQEVPVSAMRHMLVFSANHAWRPCAWGLLAATLAALLPVPAAAAADAASKLVVGYVAAVSSDHFVPVLDRAGYPGQVRGTQVRLALDRNTRVLDSERPAAPAAIQVRRQATVIYDETRGTNVAREVRLIGTLPAGVALPGAETTPRNPPEPDSSPTGAVTRGDGWPTSSDAFVAKCSRSYGRADRTTRSSRRASRASA
ncbi:MAG TPA: hypothetical protein VK548_15565, partial [Candidatus Acidoferrum sp.]|nr:hypothetical protein [Candidatus Acidoferrum sp.]